MPLDAYSLCPCGTGKKVKFCCPDLLGELQKIDRMLEGEQSIACLQHIERLLLDHPDRACLLSLKTLLLRTTGRLEEVGPAVKEFIEKHPQSTIAMAESAILTAVEQGSQAGVEVLHRALAASEGQIQARLYEAMGTVAEILLRDGRLLAGRALLQLQTAIVGDDERPVALLVRLNRMPGVPLLLKDDPPLATCPNDAPWRDRFERAMEPVQSGNWLAAAERLTALAEEVDGSPAVWRNLATLRGWLADRDGHVLALHKLATLEVPLEEAVEAEALAMLCAEDPLGDQVDLLNLMWTVEDLQRLQAALDLDRRALQIPFDPSMFASEDGPAPKAAYLLLDRALAETAVGATLADVSRVLGQAMIYARQTDRPARLEVIGVASGDLEQLKTVLAETAGDALKPEVQQEVMARASASRELLQRKWQLPADVTREQIEGLAVEHNREALLNRWPQLELGIFDGRSARQAADEEAWQVKLSAAVMVLELWQEQAPDTFDFDELRRELRLPVPEPIDPRQSPVETLPLVRLARVAVERADDESLRMGFRRATAFGATAAQRKFGLALVERPAFAGSEEQSAACASLARTETDPARALDYIQRGRGAAVSAGRSCASWDLMELTFRYGQRQGEEVSRLINHLQGQHIREPGVAEALTQWLVEVGAIHPDGTPAVPQPTPAAAEAQPADDPGKLWTPDSQQPGGEKKIWTPD